MSEIAAKPARPRIVIASPAFNEEANLPRYEQTVREVLLSRPDYDFRVLFVDDGSRDRTWEIMREICARDPRFRAIRLSRNFGGHLAESAALAHADGDAVVPLACDLQDPPETILQFLEKWRAGAQIVWGHRRTRDDPAWRKFTSRMFLGLMRRFAMPPDSQVTTGGFVLMDRKVVDCLLRFGERNRVNFALVAWTGFEQAVVEYDRAARTAGSSGWTLGKMLRSMYDAFIGFSFLPVRLMTSAGIAMFALTMAIAAYMVVNWMTGHPLVGWTSIMVVVTFLFGLQFLLMGMMGEYLYRIYAEVVHRPLYLVSDTIGIASGEPAAGGAQGF
ncbi:MAG: glycosyltransferase family 2 protein [Candidatus Binataceae bacterium]